MNKTEQLDNKNKFQYKFSQLVDVEEFNKLLENFYKITGIANGLVDNDGTLLFKSDWSDACNNFHRINPLSNQLCEESNICLMNKLENNQVSFEECKNGLVDYATPIEIEGNTLATIFLGQVLHKKPDIHFFTQQADKFQFDKVNYLKAIDNIPVVSEEKIKTLFENLILMAQMLAKIGLSKLKENRLEEKLNKSEEQSIQLKDVLDFSPVGISWVNTADEIEYINYQFTNLFGYNIDDLPNLDVWYEKAFPDLKYRKEVFELWNKEREKLLNKESSSLEIEVNVTCKDRSQKRVSIRTSLVNGKKLATFNDVTKYWKSELRNRTHYTMLELVAKDTSLEKILHNIVLTIENEEPDTICSILLLDKEGKRLLTGAAPHLPKKYNEGIHGVKIGYGVGSCGTAAFLAKRVIVEDINTHPYWQPYKHLALNAGLQACWSEPIFSSNGKILGTFAIYHKAPSSPTASDIERISFAANLASIAIENRNSKEKLEEQAYNDYLTNIPNRRYFIERAEEELEENNKLDKNFSLIMFDIDHFKKINDDYGHKMGDIVLQKIAECSSGVLRENEIIGRIGGEEFAIALPNTDISIALKIAERLRTTIMEQIIEMDNIKLFEITASFGVVENKEKLNIDELLIQVDLALYEAKNAGRNRVVAWVKK